MSQSRMPTLHQGLQYQAAEDVSLVHRGLSLRPAVRSASTKTSPLRLLGPTGSRCRKMDMEAMAGKDANGGDEKPIKASFSTLVFLL
jgi:hypothetical protein